MAGRGSSTVIKEDLRKWEFDWRMWLIIVISISPLSEKLGFVIFVVVFAGITSFYLGESWEIFCYTYRFSWGKQSPFKSQIYLLCKKDFFVTFYKEWKCESILTWYVFSFCAASRKWTHSSTRALQDAGKLWVNNSKKSLWGTRKKKKGLFG